MFRVFIDGFRVENGYVNGFRNIECSAEMETAFLPLVMRSNGRAGSFIHMVVVGWIRIGSGVV